MPNRQGWIYVQFTVWLTLQNTLYPNHRHYTFNVEDVDEYMSIVNVLTKINIPGACLTCIFVINLSTSSSSSRKNPFLHLTLSLLVTDVVFRQKVKGPVYKLLMFF
jgi:hypothetical protein